MRATTEWNLFFQETIEKLGGQKPIAETVKSALAKRATLITFVNLVLIAFLAGISYLVNFILDGFFESVSMQLKHLQDDQCKIMLLFFSSEI